MSCVAVWFILLALFYYHQGEYKEARPLFERALAIDEKVHGSGHSNIVISLSNLAALHEACGNYDQAKLLFKQALAIKEKELVPRLGNLNR